MENRSSWWLSHHTPEKYEFVKWNYYSQLNGKINIMFQTTNQEFRVQLM